MLQRLRSVCGLCRLRPHGQGRVGTLPLRRGFIAALALLGLFLFLPSSAPARQRRRAPAGGRVAVVVDERLAALRDAPELTAGLLQRLGRGRLVAVTGAKEGREGVRFYRVLVTRRTAGWVQADALVSPGRADDDARLLRLIRASREFDRVVRARIFLDTFPRSRHRAAVLLLLGEAAAEAAPRLTREARRRVDEREIEASGAPLQSYYLNYSGLDRFRRNGIIFTFDATAKEYRYNGAAWREILRRHPRSPEAAEARSRLAAPPMK